MLGIAVLIAAGVGLFLSRHAVDAMYLAAPAQTAVAIACYVVLAAVAIRATSPRCRPAAVLRSPWIDARCRVDLDD